MIGPGTGRLIAGDPLRALAALAIVVSHCGYAVLFTLAIEGRIPEDQQTMTALFGPVGAALLQGLALGVFVFFVLSGFLITRPFLRAWIAGERPPPAGRYVLRRVLRIVPVFWFTVVVLWLIAGPSLAGVPDLVTVLAFLQTMVPSSAAPLVPQAWSLDVEMIFYLAVPVVAFALDRALRARLSRRGRIAVFAGLLLACWIASTAIRSGLFQAPGVQGGVLGVMSPAAFIWAFVPGIALAALDAAGMGDWLRRKSWAPRVPLVLAAVGLAGLIVWLLVAPNAPVAVTAPLMSLLVVVLSGALVGAVITRQWAGLPARRWLDNPVLQWIGVRSYSVYILHVAVLARLESPAVDVGGSPGAAFLLLVVTGTPLILAISHLTYEFIEKPFLRLKPKRSPA